MYRPKMWILFEVLCILKLVHSETDMNRNKDDKNMPYSGTGSNVKSAVELPFLAITPRKIVVMMETDLMVTLNYTIPCHDNEDSYIIQAESGDTDLFILTGNTTFIVSCRDAQDTNIAKNDQTSFALNETDKYIIENATILIARGSVQLKLHGILLGITDIDIKLKHIGNSLTSGINNTDVTEDTYITDVIERTFNVDVLRVMRPIDDAFKVIVGCFISIVIMGFGCGLDLEVVKECVKKPVAPVIGLGCQYILMPLIGFMVAKLVPIENRAITFGIFVCGVCPGGGSSNVYSFLLGGDVNLSITMTLISTVAALGLMPFWIYTLGRQFIDDDFNVVIPYMSMLQTLAMITVPLFIGILIKIKFPKFAIKFVKILKPVTVVLILIFIGVGIYSNFYIFKLFRPEYILAGGLLPYCGYLAGGIVAAILRQPWTRIKTIALETGMQNTSIAYFLMVTSFSPPLGDIAALAPVASKIATPIPLMLITFPYLLYKRCTRTHESVTVVSDEETKLSRNGDIGDIENRKDKQFLTDKDIVLNGTDDQKPIVFENLSSV